MITAKFIVACIVMAWAIAVSIGSDHKKWQDVAVIVAALMFSGLLMVLS